MEHVHVRSLEATASYPRSFEGKDMEQRDRESKRAEKEGRREGGSSWVIDQQGGGAAFQPSCTSHSPPLPILPRLQATLRHQTMTYAALASGERIGIDAAGGAATHLAVVKGVLAVLLQRAPAHARVDAAPKRATVWRMLGSGSGRKQEVKGGTRRKRGEREREGA